MCKFSRYLGAMFLSLTIVSGVSDENKNETTYVLATALFYRDSEGVALLVTGPLSPDANKLITRDLRERLPPPPPPPLQVKVIPVYKNLYDVPVHKNLWKRLKSLYHANMFMLNLKPVESRRLMQNIEKRVFMYNKTVSNINKRRKKKHKKTTSTTSSLWNVQSSLPSTSPDDFIPNYIYYAVEKRCANWVPWPCSVRSSNDAR